MICFLWKIIWRLKVPERVRHFIWIMCHGRLLTNYNKHRMELDSVMCEFCGNTIETILHLMRDCPLVMPMWLIVVQPTVCNQFFTGNAKHWMNLNLSNDVGWNQDIEWRSFWAMACHFLRSWRNKENHDVNFKRPTHQSQHAFKSVSYYYVVNKANRLVIENPRRVVLIGWKPPSVGWVKMNRTWRSY